MYYVQYDCCIFFGVESATHIPNIYCMIPSRNTCYYSKNELLRIKVSGLNLATPFLYKQISIIKVGKLKVNQHYLCRPTGFPATWENRDQEPKLPH